VKIWVSRYLNRGTRQKILHAFGETEATVTANLQRVTLPIAAQPRSFCGRIELAQCERTDGELFSAEKFGSRVDHCISCERTVVRRTRFQ